MSYQFHYTLQGDRNLPVVLFLHGFMGSHADFDEPIAHLVDQFCCLAIDLPGHGQTQVLGDAEQYTMPQTAQAVIDLLDQLGIARCFLVGYSMGGRLALYLALHFAQRFPRVVLESASPGLKTDRERQERLQRDWELADQLEADFASFLSDWYNQPLFHPLRSHPHFEQIQARRWQNCPQSLATSLRYLSTGQQPSLWPLLSQQTQPLLLLVGDDDRKFHRLNQEIANLCPTAHLQTIPHCGHVVHLEQPVVFTDKIRTFFSVDKNS